MLDVRLLVRKAQPNESINGLPDSYPSTEEAEVGGFWVLGQGRLQGEIL